jgi:hypothetical protein
MQSVGVVQSGVKCVGLFFESLDMLASLVNVYY